MACTTRCTRVRGTAALALPGSCTALDTPARRAVVNVIADGRASGDAREANPRAHPSGQPYWEFEGLFLK